MSKDEKVISLDERRRGREEPREPGEASAAAPAEKDADSPLPGRLIWLHCPTCDTYQYTELAVEGGRQHNVCGSVVEEVVVDIDVRAEMTMAEFNLQRLSDLADFLAAERSNFEEYRKRLQLIAGRKVSGYGLTETTLRKLPASEVNMLGLLIPDALAHPEKRFPRASDDTEPGQQPDGPTKE